MPARPPKGTSGRPEFVLTLTTARALERMDQDMLSKRANASSPLLRRCLLPVCSWTGVWNKSDVVLPGWYAVSQEQVNSLCSVLI
jgi:hypothetical protein